MKLTCKTDYPYDLKVNYTVEGEGNLAIRIPGWCRLVNIVADNAERLADRNDGYAYFRISGKAEIHVSFADTPYFVYASPKVPRLTGMAALCRGPLVYCFEGADNDGDVLSLSLDTSVQAVASEEPEQLGGTVKLRLPAFRAAKTEGLYTAQKPEKTQCEAVAVPYFTWGSRGENQMRVWLPISN